MAEFDNKVAIVTGSSMGIGKSVARQLLESGALVVINGRNRQRLESATAYFRELGFAPLAVVADVSNSADCVRLVSQTLNHFGRIDILVNNAGASMEGELVDLNPDVFKKVVDVNLLGSVNATKAALAAINSSQGSIMFISSVAGLAGLPGYSPYSASKMALSALSQSLRNELYDRNVHVGIAYVGFTKNDPAKQIFNARGELTPQPTRDFVNAAPVEMVAKKILKMIERRQNKKFFSPLGKFTDVVSRISPSLVDWLIRRVYSKHAIGAAMHDKIEESPLTIVR